MDAEYWKIHIYYTMGRSSLVTFRLLLLDTCRVQSAVLGLSKRGIGSHNAYILPEIDRHTQVQSFKKTNDCSNWYKGN